MPAERTKSWSYQDADMYSTQMVWQAPVAKFIEPSPQIVELDDDDLPPLVDAPPLSSYPPPPAMFTFVSSGDDFTNNDTPAPRKRAASHSKKRPENHIPRPPNAFILFRSSFIKAQHVSTSIETNHSTLSKIIGLTWKNLSEGERKHWHEEAKKELEKHKKRFPKYAFKPQQTKTKGSGAKGGGDSGGGGTGKRKVREVEPKDEKRCAKIAELLVQGVKGNELNAKMEEFDRTHVPEIVTRFEAPMTESHYQVDDQSFRRGSSAPIEETELKIEQASFLPKAKAPKKVRRSISERPTRASTPQTQKSVNTTPAVIAEEQQLELQQPAFDFTNFSFDAAPSMTTPYPTTVGPTSTYPVPHQSFSNDLSIDTSFMQMQDWSACSSPVSPSPSFSMPSTPNFEAQSPSPVFASSPSPAPVFTAQMNMFSLNDKTFNDYNQYNVTMPTYQQGVDGFGGDAYLGVDSYGFDAGMNMDAYNPSGYAGFDAVPQYAF